MLRKIVLILLFIHTAISFYVLRETGLASVFPPFNELYAYQIFSDLGVSLSLVMLFLYVEMKRKRKPFGPLAACGVGVLLVGSFAPLVFLLIRKDLFNDSV